MTPTPRPASDPLSALGKIAAPFIKDALREEAYKERIRALTAELAEAKRLSEQYLAASRDNLECYRRAEKERDAALARVKELEYWRNGSWAMKALDKARDERDAAQDKMARALQAAQKARAEAEALRAEFEDLICHFQGACDCTHTNFMDTYKARLSPPAPAQVPFLGADWPGNKPAPETGKCSVCQATLTNGTCSFDPRHDEHDATAKAVVGKESKMGLEATAPLEAPTQPPAAETAPCKHGYGNTRCPHGCNDYTAPAPALCKGGGGKHSWVEEENEADQRQMACEKCGATKRPKGGREE